MTALTHQWNHRYTTPIRGQALKAARPGYHIALAIGEIQDTITAIKAANDETPHQWVARFPIPHNLQTISRNRPGTYISLSLGEIQSVVDGMTGISQGDKLPTSLFASYSEHRQVLGQSGYTPDEEIVEPAAYQWTHRYPKPSTGEVIHIARPGLNIAQVITEIQNRLSALPPSDDSSSAIEEMQTWLETNCTSFIDSTSGPLNPAGDAFLYYTLDSWRAAAGIEDRPLNIEELQAGFGALKWTEGTVDRYGIRYGRAGHVGNHYRLSIKEAYDEAIADWDGNDWVDWSGPPGYDKWSNDASITISHILGVETHYWWCSITRIKTQYSVSLPVVCDRAVDIYIQNSVSPMAAGVYTLSFFEHNDYKSPYPTVSQVLKKVTTSEENSDPQMIFDYFTPDTPPILPPDLPGVDDGYVVYGYSDGYGGWTLGSKWVRTALVKWNFTNA